jgi:cephalosporin hydroxylase
MLDASVMVNMTEEKAKAIGELINATKYTQEEREQFHRIITDFNALYYRLKLQTWGSTKYLGVHVLKAPTDLWIYQEIISEQKPDCIIETGTFCGGSAAYLRDMMKLNKIEPCVYSIDTVKENINGNIELDGLEFVHGSSVDEGIFEYIKWNTRDKKKIMVILDSDHSEEHVYKEMEMYGVLVAEGSCMVVEDTNTEGPRLAVERYLLHHDDFVVDLFCEKLMLTFNPRGYLEKKKKVVEVAEVPNE